MRLFVMISAALLSLAPLACGGSDQEAADPSQQNQYGAYGQQGQYGQYQQPGQYGQQPGQYGQPGTAPTQDPGQVPGQVPGQAPSSGGQATPIAPAAVAVATPALTALAAAEVQGMQPDGGAFAAQFQDGQTFEQPFNIQPGKCYSVVGVGVGIQELDLQIAAQPAPMIPPAVLAQDNSTGPNATLGGKGSCFKNPLPIGGPAKVIMKVRGAGMAVAQIYVK